MQMSRAKMAEPIKIPFGGRLTKWTHVLD